MKEITKGIQERQKAKAPEGTTPPSLKQAKKEGKIPVIYVSVGPAELLVTEGPPQFELIPDTKLEYVKNTTANIFRDTSSSRLLHPSGGTMVPIEIPREWSLGVC